MKKLLILLTVITLASCQKDENTGIVDINDIPGIGDESTEIVDQSDMSQLQSDMLNAMNASRVAGCNCSGTTMPPVSALAWHPILEEAAMLHSEDMHDNDYFSHSGLDGRSPADRMDDAGYVWKFAGENLVSGPQEVTDAVNAFLGSENHCKTLMNGNYEEMGVGKKGNIWTVKFGRR